MNFNRMIAYFNQTNPSKKSFMSEELPLVMLHIIHNYFYYFPECELYIASCIYHLERDGLKRAMQFFELKLNELNISFSELSIVFGQRVAEVFLLSASHSWTAGNDIIQQRNISLRLVK